LIKKVVFSGILVLLGGCVTDALETKIDYKSAGTLPPLEVPPDLTAPARDTRFEQFLVEQHELQGHRRRGKGKHGAARVGTHPLAQCAVVQRTHVCGKGR